MNSTNSFRKLSCNESHKKNVDVKLKMNYLPWNINLWLNINQSLSLSDQLIYKTKMCLISQPTNKQIYD
jgi:hypothetical protein